MGEKGFGTAPSGVAKSEAGLISRTRGMGVRDSATHFTYLAIWIRPHHRRSFPRAFAPIRAYAKSDGSAATQDQPYEDSLSGTFLETERGQSPPDRSGHTAHPSPAISVENRLFQTSNRATLARCFGGESMLTGYAPASTCYLKSLT